jgi:hypothetical protein
VIPDPLDFGMRDLCVATTREGRNTKKKSLHLSDEGLSMPRLSSLRIRVGILGWSRLLFSPGLRPPTLRLNHYSSFNVLSMPSKSFCRCTPFPNHFSRRLFTTVNKVILCLFLPADDTNTVPFWKGVTLFLSWPIQYQTVGVTAAQ